MKTVLFGFKLGEYYLYKEFVTANENQTTDEFLQQSFCSLLTGKKYSKENIKQRVEFIMNVCFSMVKPQFHAYGAEVYYYDPKIVFAEPPYRSSSDLPTKNSSPLEDLWCDENDEDVARVLYYMTNVENPWKGDVLEEREKDSIVARWIDLSF